MAGENRKFGDMEASQRNLANAGIPSSGIQSNCKASGCCYMAGNNGRYCAEHEGEAHHYPQYPQTVQHFGGTSHNVSYPTRPGMPESGKGKI